MNNKIIDVQEMLIKEMDRLDECDINDIGFARTEFSRATALYNMSSSFIKSINTNLSIMNTARRNEIKYEKLMKKLGL